MPRLGSVEQLIEPWRTQAVPAASKACVGMCGAAFAGALMLARLGTPVARISAVASLAFGIVAIFVARSSMRRREGDPRAALYATVLRTEPELGQAALRALATVERTERRADTGSAELARLHVGRVLGRVRLEPIVRRAEVQAWAYSILGSALALLAFAVVVVDPSRMVEGLDVLLARRGVAPLPLEWLADSTVSAEAPTYLGGAGLFVDPLYPTTLPVGSTITVRALPLHQGRRLVLTEGEREVAFEDDGSGGLVARWVVEDDAEIRVAARFGSVLVPSPHALRIDALTDKAPIVRVERAPSTLKLLENPRIPVHWEAIDDHGLAEVQLVLRSGEREERRELAKPAGASDRGGLDLLAKDRFLDKSYVPIEVTVEARDADPFRGPKWGRSPSLVIVPPQVGELEALRHAALVAARDALTDLLAERVAFEGPRDRAWLAKQRTAQGEVLSRIEAALRKDFGGLRIPGRVTAAARGQLERLEVSLKAAEKSPKKATLDALRESTESTLLGLDSVIDALATRDAAKSARKLADVAQEAATAIKLGREPSERGRADRRLAAATGVLEGGSRHLVALGGLGLDLGEIVENGLGRIARAMKDADRHHARLAAEDLAARLRQPDPSFRSSGGSSMGGTEAGGSGNDEGPASEAAADAAGLEQALEELRREHASEMAGVEKALDDASSEDDRQSLKDELRKLAEQVRDATKQLPEQGAEPSSARSEAAQARSQAEGMASALERGELGEASEQGRRALEALDRAGKRSTEAPRGSSEQEMGALAQRSSARLRGLVKDADQQLAEQRKRSSEAARSVLEKAAQREKALADRARQIRERSEASEAPLPQQMLEKLDEAAKRMDEAAGELKARRGGKGLEAQRQAQRLLEMAQPEKEQDGERGNEAKDGPTMAQDADVPGQHKDESAERFRRRVTEGLGKRTPGSYRDAVRRYTEGLLR